MPCTLTITVVPMGYGKGRSMKKTGCSLAVQVETPREEIVAQLVEGIKAALVAADLSETPPMSKRQQKEYIAELHRAAEEHQITGAEVVAAIWPDGAFESVFSTSPTDGGYPGSWLPCQQEVEEPAEAGDADNG